MYPQVKQFETIAREAREHEHTAAAARRIGLRALLHMSMTALGRRPSVAGARGACGQRT